MKKLLTLSIVAATCLATSAFAQVGAVAPELGAGRGAIVAPGTAGTAVQGLQIGSGLGAALSGLAAATNQAVSVQSIEQMTAQALAPVDLNKRCGKLPVSNAAMEGEFATALTVSAFNDESSCLADVESTQVADELAHMGSDIRDGWVATVGSNGGVLNESNLPGLINARQTLETRRAARRGQTEEQIEANLGKTGEANTICGGNNNGSSCYLNALICHDAVAVGAAQLKGNEVAKSN